jgi:cytochrome b561
MDMDSAAVFLAGSILYALGFIIILIGVVIANNIIHKYWKSFGWTFTPSWMSQEPTRFASQDELDRIAPHLEETKNGKSQEKRNA